MDLLLYGRYGNVTHSLFRLVIRSIILSGMTEISVNWRSLSKKRKKKNTCNYVMYEALYRLTIIQKMSAVLSQFVTTTLSWPFFFWTRASSNLGGEKRNFECSLISGPQNVAYWRNFVLLLIFLLLNCGKLPWIFTKKKLTLL